MESAPSFFIQPGLQKYRGRTFFHTAHYPLCNTICLRTMRRWCAMTPPEMTFTSFAKFKRIVCVNHFQTVGQSWPQLGDFGWSRKEGSAWSGGAQGPFWLKRQSAQNFFLLARKKSFVDTQWFAGGSQWTHHLDGSRIIRGPRPPSMQWSRKGQHSRQSVQRGPQPS